ncbi:MAG: sugar ABC transporter permease [Anaerolineae bacterium]|nr:sugar ABC transporter permease [Anaerolineae bacterium]
MAATTQSVGQMQNQIRILGRSYAQDEVLAGVFFMLPAVLVFLVFLIIPIFFAVAISFTDWDGLSTPDTAQYEGLKNYSELLLESGIRQKDFFKALKNTVYYTLGVVPLQTVLALALAVVANQGWRRARSFFRTTFYFPSITSSIVISLIFMWLFTKSGLINYLLQAVFPGYTPINWLDDSTGFFHGIFNLFGLNLRSAPEWMRSDIAGLAIWDWLSGPSTTMVAIMLLNIWTTSGTIMVIFLAALQDIPRPLYEAASVDGATAWRTFRSITLPMLRPTIFFVVTIGMIGCFQVFDQIFVISSGGPAKTTLTIAWMVYRNGFLNADMGLAAATALILFAIIFVLTLIQRRVIGERARI